MNPFDLQLDHMASVACATAARSGKALHIVQGPAYWHQPEFGAEIPPHHRIIATIQPGDDPLAVCKRYHGRQKDAPPQLARTDERVKLSPRSERAAERIAASIVREILDEIRAETPRQSTFSFGD
jgi:hypothetical protein